MVLRIANPPDWGYDWACINCDASVLWLSFYIYSNTCMLKLTSCLDEALVS